MSLAKTVSLIALLLCELLHCFGVEKLLSAKNCIIATESSGFKRVIKTLSSAHFEPRSIEMYS